MSKFKDIINYLKGSSNVVRSGKVEEGQSFENYAKNAVVSLDQIFEKNSYYNSNAVTQPAKNSYLVFKCLQVLSDRIPKVPLQFFDIRTGDQILPMDNEAANFIMNPGDITFFEFLSNTIMYYSLYGESFWVWVENVGTMSGTSVIPSGIEVIDPLALTEEVDYEGVLIRWQYVGTYLNTVIRRSLERDKVIQIKNSNPYNYWRGLRATDAISTILGVDVKSTEELLRFYDNFAIPGTILTAPADSPITPEDMDSYVKRMDAGHRGVDKRFRTTGFSGGITASTIGVSPDKQQLSETKDWIRDSVLAVFNVPLTYAGYKVESRALAETQERIFWQGGASLLKRIEMTINGKILSRLDPTIEARFDYDAIDALKKDIKETTEAATKLFAMGWSADDVNEKFNWDLPEHEGITDKHYKPFNLEVIGEDDEPVDNTQSETVGELTEDALRGSTVKKKFNIIQNKQEKLMKKKFWNFLNNQRVSVIKSLNFLKNSIDKVTMYQTIERLKKLFDSEDARLERMVTPQYSDTVRLGQEHAHDLLGITDRDVILNTKIIKERANLIKGMNESTFKRVKDQIFKGVNEGETLTDIAKRIRTIYDFNTSRSKLIARTETTNLINNATNEEYKANGVAMKAWLTAEDSEVRETCRTAAAQGPILVDNTFANGLQYPSEYNCRCAISPVIQ